MLEYIFQRKLLFAFAAAVLLLGGLSFGVYGLSRCLDRERWQSEDKMLDSLRRLPNVTQVSADLEIYFCSRTDIHFIYVVHVRCKRGRGCPLPALVRLTNTFSAGSWPGAVKGSTAFAWKLEAIIKCSINRYTVLRLINRK